MLGGLIALIACQLAGEVIVHWLLLPISGAVVGMLLLFAYLVLRAVLGRPEVPESISQAATGLISHLTLFFLPAGIGILFLPPELAKQWWPLVLATVPGTVIAVGVTAWVTDRLLGNHTQQVRADD